MELWELRVLVAECFLAVGDARQRGTTRRFKVSVAEGSHVEPDSAIRWDTSPVSLFASLVVQFETDSPIHGQGSISDRIGMTHTLRDL
jgi:hypothetical protein